MLLLHCDKESLRKDDGSEPVAHCKGTEAAKCLQDHDIAPELVLVDSRCLQLGRLGRVCIIGAAALALVVWLRPQATKDQNGVE